MRLRPKLRPGLPQATPTNRSHQRRNPRRNRPTTKRSSPRLSTDSALVVVLLSCHSRRKSTSQSFKVGLGFSPGIYAKESTRALAPEARFCPCPSYPYLQFSGGRWGFQPPYRSKKQDRASAPAVHRCPCLSGLSFPRGNPLLRIIPSEVRKRQRRAVIPAQAISLG